MSSPIWLGVGQNPDLVVGPDVDAGSVVASGRPATPPVSWMGLICPANGNPGTAAAGCEGQGASDFRRVSKAASRPWLRHLTITPQPVRRGRVRCGIFLAPPGRDGEGTVAPMPPTRGTRGRSRCSTRRCRVTVESEWAMTRPRRRPYTSNGLPPVCWSCANLEQAGFTSDPLHRALVHHGLVITAPAPGARSRSGDGRPWECPGGPEEAL
jgi:hypothetical protein